MGGTNQETWKQPPASLNVEWPTDRMSKRGPTLEEQKARMRETRAKVANAIASSGFPVPIWPEVGQRVKRSASQQKSRGEELTDLGVGTGGRLEASRTSSSRIPLRYQNSTQVADTTKLLPRLALARARARGDEYQTSGSPWLAGPPPSPRRQVLMSEMMKSTPSLRPPPAVHARGMPNSTQTDQLQDPPGVPSVLKPSNPPKTSHTYQELPSNIDPSIFNPRVFVVEVPDIERVLQRLQEFSGLDEYILRPDLQWELAKRIAQLEDDEENQARARDQANSETTETTKTESRHQPVLQEKHARKQSAHDQANSEATKTTKTESRRQRKLPKRDDRSKPAESSKTAVLRVNTAPPSLEQGPFSAPTATVTHRDTKASCILGTPPGFETRRGAGSAASKGTMSTSKVWVSKVERLRVDFASMQKRARCFGFDKSPFLPKNTVEYAEVLAEMKTKAANCMRKKIEHNENQHTETAVQEYDPTTQELQLFHGRKMDDKLSAVLAMNTCFNELPRERGQDQMDWPPSSEFQSWTDPRTGRRRSPGVWPPPHVNNKPRRSGQILEDSKVDLYSDKKMAFWPSLDWRLRSERDVDEFYKPAPTIPLDWLCIVNPILAAFIKEIEEGDGVLASE
ncbi:hypothetical protein VPNG_09412 [Cytospora leucostoma]|uniref:Uncharacterized protein n=1 Tax=Cytospora leucostoma TaxID=1230097 RepID=A0A423VPT2_9PEZI|nr:hypothetical protein VPNG_09412 [Cytospora leucostoma]